MRDPRYDILFEPVQARALSKSEIGDLRRWFVNAAKRSKAAGFDIVSLYGAHGLGIFQHFLSRATNHCGDEYGGSLENRARFAQEVIAEIRDTMAITLHVSLGETIGELGFSNAELREFAAKTRNLQSPGTARFRGCADNGRRAGCSGN